MVRKRFSSTASVKSSEHASAEENISKSRSNSQSRSSLNVKTETKSSNSPNNGPKYRNRQQRELNKIHPPMPIRLNKRLRKLEREKYIQSIAPHTVAQNTTAQETLSANWNVLQTALNGDEKPIEHDGQQKRRRNSSANSHNGKKAKTEDTNSDSDYVEAEDDLDTIIKSINIEDKADKMKKGSKLAWIQNVDPFLVDDELIVPVTPCQESDIEESDGEDAVTVDMDQEDDFIAAKETMMTQSDKMKEKRRIDGITSVLARVSIVDSKGNVLYDKYAQPSEPVTDYRTQYSGIRKADLIDAPSFSVVQAEVAALIKRRLLVGHALKNDLDVLQLTHPVQLIRDTSLYRPFIQHYRRGSPSLKNLSRDFLGATIQEGEHDSVTDARVAMRLYSLNRVKWERNVQNGTKGNLNKSMLARNRRGNGRAPPRRRWNHSKKKIGKASHSKSRKSKK